MTKEQVEQGKKLSDLIEFHEEQRAYFDKCALYLANDENFEGGDFIISTPYSATPIGNMTVRRSALSDFFIKEGKYHFDQKQKYERQLEKL